MPHVTVIVRGAPGAEGRGLAATIESLRRQSLSTWRAIVLNTTNEAAELYPDYRVSLAGSDMAPAIWSRPPSDVQSDFLCVIRVGDRLGADALMELSLEARLAGAEFVFADERAHDVTEAGALRSFFKPGWSADLLLETNYIGRAWCASRPLVERVGLDLRGIDRRGDYDAVLKLTEAARGVSHLPNCLIDRSGRRMDTPRREREALLRTARRRGIDAEPVAGAAPGVWRMRRALPETELVSVIIPTRGARGLIRGAIGTLRATADWPIEVIVIDTIPRDEVALKSWVASAADRVVDYTGAFNWSAMNNAAVAAARGTYLLFLNDDTECTGPGWLQAMLEHAQRTEVGAVGPLLTYGDGKVQHAGMFLRGTEARHAFRFADPADPGPFGLAAAAREVSAVTGACLLTRRAVFDALGGFDVAHGVIMNDVDYCLRVTASGLRCIYTPHAQLVHHEMASRAMLGDRHDVASFDAAWGVRMLAGDPWLHPGLAAESDDWQAEDEPVELIQPGRSLLDAARLERIVLMCATEAIDGQSFVYALPALRRLRLAFPNAAITLAAPAADILVARGAQLVDAGVEIVDEAEPHPALRALHADLAIDLRLQPEHRQTLRSTAAAVLAGFDHGGRFGWLDIAEEWDEVPRLLDKRSHASALTLRLIGSVIDAAEPPGEAAVPINMPEGLLLGNVQTDRAVVCIVSGAGGALTRWPAQHYAGLARLLHARGDVVVVLLGPGASEVARLAAIAEAVVLLGTAPDGLLEAAALLVGDDGEWTRQAAAAGRPVVTVAASHVDAAEWGPCGPRALTLRRRMSCGPCYISAEADCPRGVSCLRAITPAAVYRACRLLLAFRLGSDAS